MSNRTCSVERCDRPLVARGLCRLHYLRAWRAEHPPAARLPASKPCRGCGELIQPEKPTDRRLYHSLDCRPPCSIEGCDLPVAGRGWCAGHARRASRTGDPVPEEARNRNGGECSVEGCDNLMRKRTWCAGHYSMWQREGEVRPFGYRWAEREAGCLVCDSPTTATFRQFCSAKCHKNYRLWGGVPPATTNCVICGTQVPLVKPNGERRPSTTRLCRRCRRHSRKHGISVVELAQRDGMNCGICKQAVDLDAATGDPMRPSVDHIWPRAHGGTNAPANLQLAHLACNIHKRDSVPA